MLVLAAREDQVTEANAGALQCRLVAEGANGPTSVGGLDEILALARHPRAARRPHERRRRHGQQTWRFEWVQDLSRLFWDRDEIRRRLAEKLADAFDRVWALSEARALSLRDAALVAGIRDVAAALEARGMYP